MRRVRLVAPILIAIMAVAHVTVDPMALRAASLRGGGVDVMPWTPAGDIATVTAPQRVTSASEVTRTHSHAIAASSSTLARGGSRGRSAVPRNGFVAYVFESDAAQGRAPPSPSC